MKNPQDVPAPKQEKQYGRDQKKSKIQDQDKERRTQGPSRESDGQGRKREH